MAEQKRAARKELLGALNALTPSAVQSASAAIVARLESLLTPAAGEVVALFAARPLEVDLSGLERFLQDRGAEAAYPVIDGDALVFRRAWSDALRPAHFGIAEPTAAAPLAQTFHAIITPGLGFGPSGARLGYGRGYYDRAIRAARSGPRRPWVVGVAFELQWREAVPMGASDEALDALVTERAFRSFDDRGSFQNPSRSA
ncbi:MAG: 5-formyltetrahydrofolate cyclo-ligase [Myxococcota bacterium]